MLSFAFIIVFVLYGNANILSNLANIRDSINNKSIESTNAKTKSNVIYVVMSDQTLWVKLNKCLENDGISLMFEDIGNSVAKMSKYSDSECKTLQASRNLPYTTEAPSMKYIAEAYSDGKCSTSVNWGVLTNSLEDGYKLNECKTEDGESVKFTCNEGYKEKGGECVSGGMSILIGLLSIVLMMTL